MAAGGVMRAAWELMTNAANTATMADLYDSFLTARVIYNAG
jgi:hypothetical protein